MQSSTLFLVLCGLAGALHAISPDHWVPGSILSWQRGWSAVRILALCLTSFALHVALGAGLYFAGVAFLSEIPQSQLFGFSVVFVAVIALLRGFRFSRIREVLRNGKSGVWGLFSALSLLGPAESLVPVLVKSHHVGVGYASPIAIYFAGTLVAGFGLLLWGRRAWNRPLVFTRGMEWAQRRMAVIPAVAAIGLGLSLLIRLG